MVWIGWLCLAAMIFVYGAANLLQSIAARRTRCCHSLQPSLLLRLANQRIYLFGVVFQVLGFALAFFARRELPLFLVQASVAAGLGVMALLGVLFMRWRLPRAEIGLLALLGAGIGGLVIAARPGVAHHLRPGAFTVLVAVLVAIGVLGFFAARLRGTLGTLALGSLAGLAFGAAAVDSRVLAGAHHLSFVVAHPLLYLLFAHAPLGQLLLGLALQRGPTTVAVAAMDAAATAPAAVIGLALLGDQIRSGLVWLAVLGFTCTLGAVLGLTRYARPQEATVEVPRTAAAPALPGARPVALAPRQRTAPPARLSSARSSTRNAGSAA
ncbi:MAG TPA: hypothetical protein VFR11_19625 [Micromonosporaceae bacterium]|nr:hypothetical protein [Micromonosporaceae bacterium]